MEAFLTSPWVLLVLVGTFVGSLVALPVLVALLPADYFAAPEPPPSRLSRTHPLLRTVLRVGSNLAGAILILAGIAMLVLPGQGLLTLLFGLILTDFPGKRRLELALVRRGPIRRGMNWMRARAGRPPLRVSEVDEPAPPEPSRREPSNGSGGSAPL